MGKLPDVTCQTTGRCVRRPAWNETPVSLIGYKKYFCAQPEASIYNCVTYKRDCVKLQLEVFSLETALKDEKMSSPENKRMIAV